MRCGIYAAAGAASRDLSENSLARITPRGACRLRGSTGYRMRTEDLKEFLVLAEVKSYWKASERLYISQSTLSRHIKDLETNLGVMLFKRSTRNVELTNYGAILLPYAKRFIQLEDELSRDLSAWMEMANNTITIGLSIGWGEIEISDILAEFHKEHAKVRMNLMTLESIDMYKMLEDDSCDFAFIREGVVPDDGFERYFVSKDRLCVYTSVMNSLAQKESVTLAELEGESFVMSDKASLTYLVGTKVCRENGFEPSVIFSGNRVQSIQYLRKGIGVGLLFGQLPTSYRGADIACIELEPPIYADIYLVCKRKNMNPVQQAFLDYLFASGFVPGEESQEPHGKAFQ